MIPRYTRSQRGFTLVESIMVIAITGVVAGMVAVFIQGPVRGYFDTARRAELSDEADTALRRIGRDLRGALPNSLRVTSSGGVQFLEFIPAVDGGRYRLDTAGESCFIAGCTSLTSVGSLITADDTYKDDWLVIFNYYNNAGNDCGTSLPSAYCGQNRTLITGSTEAGTADVLSFASTRFYPPGGSPGRRFQIVQAPVSYICDPGSGLLTRQTGYGFVAAQPTTTGGVTLADAVSGCTFAYQPGVLARLGLVSLRLTLSEAGESVTLYHEVHVDNAP